MKFLGFELSRVKKALTPVADWGRGWGRVILEPFAGAWQRNIEEKVCDVLCYPTLYACLSRVSQDIGKLPFRLVQEDANGIWQTVQNPAYSPVLRKPNLYQTAQQFREAWVLSILQSGNTYVLKERDNRGVVVRLYVLDPCRVMPMISEDGAIFYQVYYPFAQNLLPLSYPSENLIVPASEIIHDRMNCFHHQLIGVPPLCAAHWPALKNLKILKNETEFFANGARPGGILTAPAGISEEDATKVMQAWQKNYGGANAGKVAVLGGDLKYTDIGSASGADSQLVEQMRYSDEQICQPFGIPPFIVGIGSIPAAMKVDDMAGMYYQFALQARIEAMENLLDEGLAISAPLGAELDLEPLLRMDFEKRARVWGQLNKDGIAAPNEGRQQFNLRPLEGGDTVYKQQQDLPLDQARLNKAPSEELPALPAPEVVEEPAEQGQERAIIAAITKAFDERAAA